ncbi:MAG: IS30 family transposase [Gemmatimonadaceae bacterium]
MARRWRRITPEKRRQIIGLAAKGWTQRQIADAVDLSRGAVGIVVTPLGGVIRKEMWNHGSRRLSIEDRVEIKLGLEAELSLRAIARRIDRDPATVCREVNANGGRARYAPVTAHRRAFENTRRPKATKLAAHPELCARVIADLELLWSPQQIADRLRDEFGDDHTMRISHETIYKTLYVQGRGELRRELARCLRTGRAKRVPHGRIEKRGRIPDMVMISERPAEVEDRAVPGHWEGDLLMGKNGKSAIGTLVERHTRFVMLFPLRKGKTAEHVRDEMTATIQSLPAALRRTLTWDQGREMSQHVQFSIDTGVDVYFCDPRSPWQRGSNENTNGLLRQFFPHGRGLMRVTDAELQRAADLLNGRPRRTLGGRTPSEKFAEVVASIG